MKHVVTIGNFDGVHRGHRELIRRLITLGQELSATPTVITFDPPPSILFGKNPKYQLYDLRTKINAFKDLGIVNVKIIKFNDQIANLRADDFLDKVVGLNNISAIIEGDNFVFGVNRHCDTKCLLGIGNDHNIKVEIISTETNQVSSSKIRDLLSRSKIQLAWEMFGKYQYNYRSKPFQKSVSGMVVKGNGWGRELGARTANLDCDNHGIIDGIYCGQTRLSNNHLYNSAISVHDGQIEVHLLDFKGDLYGQRIFVNFINYLRPFIKFNDKQALMIQIKKDLLQSWELLHENDT